MNTSKLTNQKEIKKLTLLFMFTYMVSYITRTNYGAIISEMVQATSFTKSMLSMSLTGSFITYGLGQVISGVLGDKFSPKKLVSIGFVITVCMNLLIPLCTNPYQMLAQRGLNIPQNLNNPNDILQYLLNTNQITQQQVNNVMMMLQRR